MKKKKQEFSKKEKIKRKLLAWVGIVFVVFIYAPVLFARKGIFTLEKDCEKIIQDIKNRL